MHLKLKPTFENITMFIFINAAYVVGPSVMTYVFNWFFLPKPSFLEFIWILNGRNHPHFESKPYQINSFKSYSSRSFQQHQRHIPIPLKFSAMI
jgi:hypothetical protein